jgi:hypothetical protein
VNRKGRESGINTEAAQLNETESSLTRGISGAMYQVSMLHCSHSQNQAWPASVLVSSESGLRRPFIQPPPEPASVTGRQHRAK